MRAKVEVGDIFRRFGPDFRQKHRLSMAQHQAMNAIEACRTEVLGGHIDQCDQCGHQRISYNSCRNRHCPKCQGLARARWLEARKTQMLDVKHFHLVFTLPHQLHPLIRANEKLCYDLLFQAASQTVMQLARDPKHLGVKAGMLTVLHTWGQNLIYHPHLHCLVPAGGVSLDGNRWIDSRSTFFLPVKVLSRLFRGKFMAALKQAFRQGRLTLGGEMAGIDTEKKLNNFLRPIYQKEWVVYAKEPFGGLEQVIGYLGRYTHRVAIANERIIAIEEGRVRFRYKDYQEQGKQKVMALKPEEFIRRFLLHILPKGFHKIRYYGILASRNRHTDLKVARKTIGQVQPQAPIKLTYRQYYLKIWGRDLSDCPCCSSGKMRTVLLIPPTSRAPPIRLPAKKT